MSNGQELNHIKFDSAIQFGEIQWRCIKSNCKRKKGKMCRCSRKIKTLPRSSYKLISQLLWEIWKLGTFIAAQT